MARWALTDFSSSVVAAELAGLNRALAWPTCATCVVNCNEKRQTVNELDSWIGNSGILPGQPQERLTSALVPTEGTVFGDLLNTRLLRSLEGLRNRIDVGSV